MDNLHCKVPTLFATRHGNIIVSPVIDVLSMGSISKRCAGKRTKEEKNIKISRITNELMN